MWQVEASIVAVSVLHWHNATTSIDNTGVTTPAAHAYIVCGSVGNALKTMPIPT